MPPHVTDPHHVSDPTPAPGDPWWSNGWVGGLLVSAVAGIVFAVGVEVALPLVETAPSAPVEDTRLVNARTGPVPSVGWNGWNDPLPTEETAPSAAPEAEPADGPEAVEEEAAESDVEAAADESAVTTQTAAERRAEARAARKRRERQAARELALLARQTFERWGPITATWTLPIASYRLSAHYGETGPHWATIHTGQDFSAPTGTPVVAASAGVVTFAGWDGPYGNKLEITHPDGTVTWYAHLSRLDVEAGAEVATGQGIGLVGSTGNSTGPHLHFEVHPDGGDASDPAAFLAEHGLGF